MAIRFLSNESIDGSITVGDDVIVSGNITLVNKTTSEVGSILLGSGNALQIYYDGSNSFVSDSGTGDLYVRSNSTLILKSATTKVQAFGSSVDFVTINSTGATFAGIITANSSSSGDYVRLYGSSGTGKWDIYGNGANLRISDNESAGILAVDTGATFGGNVDINGSNTILTLSAGAAEDITLGFDEENSGTINGKLYWDASDNKFKLATVTAGDVLTIQDSNGNVGIGTDSPDFALDIEGLDSGVQLQIGRTNSSAGSTWMGSDSSGFHLGVGAYGAGNSVADPNGFTVDTSGNVGIGTTSPDEKLDVENGNIRLKSNSDGNTGIFKMYDASGTESGQIYPAGGDLKIYSPNDILFTQTGNVGIGDVTPSFPLVISKSSSTPSMGADLSMRLGLNNPDQTNNNLALITFGDGTSQPGSGFFGMQFTDHTNDYGELVFGTRGAGGYGERMRITSGGDVIIGGTVVENPASINRVLEIAAASPVGLILNDTRDPNPMTIANEGAVLNFKYNTTNMMTLPPSGDIQIPTNSASLQLRSSGSASYTSIRRDAANQLIVANTAGNQVFGIGNGGELAITNGASYSGTETYSNAWNAGYQTLILGSQLSPDSVYIITINVGSGFGTPPYYASAVFTIITAPSTNSTGGGFDNIAPTATHVSSNAYWKYRLSCIGTGRNGVEAWLVNGPTNPPVNPTIYVKATKIM
jgi:hypothetical protein